MPAPKELAICQVIKNNSILLIRADTGVGKGKWNAPSGEIAVGEKLDKGAMRNVFQQTGLYVNKTIYHGTIRLFLSGKVEYSYKLHIFSTRVFSGDLKPNIEGEARWFNTSEIPYYEMWADDKYWINLVLEGKKFDADFFLDEKNENVVKYQIRERKEVLKKALPIIIVLAVIAVIAFGILSSGILNYKQPTKTQVVFRPSTTATTTTTTVSTTTIAAPTFIPPAPFTPNNTNQTYIYYIAYSGNPPVSETYYAIANRSGISNWRILQGEPVNLKSATCSVYSFYTYCTSSVRFGQNTTAAPANTTAATSNVIKYANPVCLALHPPDPSICYDTYYQTS
jgi:8-oxo-dGTP diphosphatase